MLAFNCVHVRACFQFVCVGIPSACPCGVFLCLYMAAAGVLRVRTRWLRGSLVAVGTCPRADLQATSTLFFFLPLHHPQVEHSEPTPHERTITISYPPGITSGTPNPICYVLNGTVSLCSINGKEVWKERGGRVRETCRALLLPSFLFSLSFVCGSTIVSLFILDKKKPYGSYPVRVW